MLLVSQTLRKVKSLQYMKRKMIHLVVKHSQVVCIFFYNYISLKLLKYPFTKYLKKTRACIMKRNIGRKSSTKRNKKGLKIQLEKNVSMTITSAMKRKYKFTLP